MDHLLTLLPWVIAAALHVEHGHTLLKLLMLSDNNKEGFALWMLDSMSGRRDASEVAAARVAALCFTLGWPAFMAFGWMNARRLDRGAE